MAKRLTDEERLDIERRLAEISVNPAYVFGETGVLLAACRRLLAANDALRAELNAMGITLGQERAHLQDLAVACDARPSHSS